MLYNNAFYKKKVFVTGHTGFKGSWLVFWLLKMGANVTGYSLDNSFFSSNFNLLRLKKKINHITGDIRNYKKLKNCLSEFKPDLIFHLAAQSLVSKSYSDPYGTYLTNTVGTLNLIDIINSSKHTHRAVIITSDKVYKNIEKRIGYKENDIIGGIDPYSSSKSCAELIINSYIRTILNKNKIIVTARAGNVIGGGDWNSGRIIPDLMNKYLNCKTVTLRSPDSTRPWQHVLEPISGYLLLGQKLIKNRKFLNGEAYNFGPALNDKQITVLQLMKKLKLLNKDLKWKINNSKYFYESKLLALNCEKARRVLKWKRILNLKETLKLTNDWYYCYKNQKITDSFISQQLEFYINLAKKRKICWAQ
jgi:CDP-glucose 4,6-dehydratase